MGNRKNKRVTKKTRDLEEVLEENLAQGQAADVETEEAGHDLLNGAGNDVVNEAGNDVGTGAAGSLNEEDELEENSEEQAADEENEELGNDVVNGDDEQTQNVCEEQAANDDIVAEPKRKKQRGPTKMKHIAKDPNEKQHVDFTDMGEHCGPGSVLLSSYLGPLVREHVPVIIDTWKKVGEDIKTVLWKSIEARFDIDEDYKKNAVFKQMGCLWRASKSRLVSKVRKARTMKDRMSLRPNNVPPTAWRLFVKAKTSNAFKVVSDSFKARRKKQIPHTCGRKGMVRLREELVKSSSEPSKITRLKVWVKSRTRKDGTLVNITAAEKIQKAKEIDTESLNDSTTTNPKEDMLTQILGPDNPGRLRAMGRGMSLTKLACFQVKSKCMAAMEEKQIRLQKKVHELEQILLQRQGSDIGENSIHRSVNTKSLPKCYLVDWSCPDENVAEGRVVSYDEDELVNGIPLGPNSVKVLVELVTKPEAFLWRPAPDMFTLEDALGKMVAWDADYCIVPTDGSIPEDIAPKSPGTSIRNKCKLMNYSTNDEVIAEGRFQTREPKALVNGLPLGPNAMKVYVDVVVNPKAYLWRPTVNMRNVEDSLNCFVAWPANRVVMETTPESPPLQPSTSKASSTGYQNEKSPVTPKAPVKKPATTLKAARASPRRKLQPVAFKENQKCKLMDLIRKNHVVAEGRWSSNNPASVVHFVPLGPKACRVWVDVVKDKYAAVWRRSSEIECMEDAFGTSIAWPEDKVEPVME